MMAASVSETTKPFIAWSCAHDYNVFSPDIQRSCETHIRKAQDQLSPLVGPPAVEGIILYDHLQRGMAIASLLTRENRSLPESCDGASCDSHFDEDALCNETNALSYEARIHAGSRAMLVRLGENGGRRFILMDQRHAAHLHPMGRKANPDLSLAAFGLLAHELAHARDYADGRPGLPSLSEVSTMVAPGRAEAVHSIADMALAEYVATRAECQAQVAVHGACAEDLTRRIGQMARQEISLPALDHSEPTDADASQQRRMDLSTAGYFIGTLAAYRNVQAPIRGEDGSPLPHRTDQMLERRTLKGSPLTGILDKAMPALERAATTPNAASRRALASTLERAVIAAQQPRRDRTRPKARDTSIGDWFDEL